jgi:hypothetical protein
MLCYLTNGRRIVSCILLVLLLCLTVQAECEADQQPYGGTAWPIPGTLEMENYDTGGEGVSYHDTTSGNSGGIYRTDDVDIWTSGEAGGYYTGANSTGEWLEYTVNVAATAQYAMEFWVCTPNSSRKIHVELDGANVSGTIQRPPMPNAPNAMIL